VLEWVDRGTILRIQLPLIRRLLQKSFDSIVLRSTVPVSSPASEDTSCHQSSISTGFEETPRPSIPVEIVGAEVVLERFTADGPSRIAERFASERDDVPA